MPSTGSCKARIANGLVRVLLAASCAGMLVACSEPQRRPRAVRTPVIRDTPAALRGTVAAEVSFRRIQPLLVSGYGLVVGVNGKGGGDLPENIATHMERMLGLMGVGKASDLFDGTELAGLTPRQVLRHKDVAVAVVFAAIPAGAPQGARFDVFVRAVNAAGTASVEGGKLWTTDLQIGTPNTVGSFKTRSIASAAGPVFINPFAEPGADDDVSRRIGRVLDGGLVTNPSSIELTLDAPSHSRARAIVSAINTRFPERPGDGGPAARGLRDTTVEVTVPREYRDRASEFLSLVEHIQIDQSFPQEYARRYAEALKSQPELGDDLAWCLQALGPAALPFVRDLYEYPELVVQLAALRAGAGLDDPRAAEPLRKLAAGGLPVARTEAIRLLGRLEAGPKVDLALRDLLAERELTIRVGAYEALAKRAETAQIRRAIEQWSRASPTVRVVTSYDSYIANARMSLDGSSLQGVERIVVPTADRRGIKFVLDLVPAGERLIYVAQQGRPRIVLFGTDLALRRPVLVSAWSDRLMLAADTPSDSHRLMYRNVDGYQVYRGKVDADVADLVQFMARQPTPEDERPGLGMTYSEVVGAIYALQRAGAIDAAFAVEEDQLRARLFQAAERATPLERPETKEQAEKLRVYDAVEPTKGKPTDVKVPPPVPIEPPPTK